MDIRRLQAFSKVYELKSFSRAGEELLLSQPTISAHILSLENELDARLFDRLARTVLPTSAADVLYRRAQEIFASLETARAEIMALRNRVAGTLVVGGSTIPGHYLLPERIAAYRRDFPEVTVDLVVGDSRDIAGQVADGQIGLGVVGAQSDHPDLEFEWLRQDEVVVITPPDMRLPPALTEGPDFDWEAFRSLPWVMREQGSGTRQAFENALRDKGHDLRDCLTSIQVHSTLAVLQCVKAGLGVSVTSRLAAGDMLDRGEINQARLPGFAIQRDFYSVTHSRRYVFPALARFKEFLAR